jgi:hypothetical protein
MSASDYLEAAVLKHIFGVAAFVAPANIYVALSTANPGENGGAIAEPVGNGYARKQTVPANWTWNAGATRIENSVDILFAAATGAWGTITHYAVFDAAGGGNLLFYGPLLAAKAVGAGDAPKYIAGTMQYTAD